MTSELTYGTEWKLWKVNSVHLSSAKRICPNYLVIESCVVMSNNNFKKASLGLFLCRANVSHKNDSANLTQKSSGLLKSGWSIYQSYFFSCFN